MREVIKTKVQNFRLSEPQEKRFKKLIGYRGYWSWSEVIIGGLLALERQHEIELANPPKLMEILVTEAAPPPPICAEQAAELVDQAAELLPLNTAAEVAEKLKTLPKKSAARKTKPAAEVKGRGKTKPPAAASKNKRDTQSAEKPAKRFVYPKGRKTKA